MVVPSSIETNPNLSDNPHDPEDLESLLNPLSILPSLVAALIPQFIDVINEGTAECDFTERARELILLQYRDKNAIIFSGDANTNDLTNAFCFDAVMNLAFFRSKTYRVCARSMKGGLKGPAMVGVATGLMGSASRR
ncbi:hypothetical protein QBC44DRAFT_394567 [Cladorrhinum sp. PSN332]|nr:hypothetical protein QBC44DRAFT_394567 [Cladorrhinum sp. PSN332]